MRSKRFTFVAIQVIAFAAAVALFPQIVNACPSCKAALASQEGGRNLVQGFFYSILFMMSMPFTLLASFGSYMWWEVRKARRVQQTEQPDPIPLAPVATTEPASSMPETA